MITALGVGLWLSALNVQFRDVRYTRAVSHPVLDVRHTDRVSEQPACRAMAHAFTALNPMVGVVEGFRWALLGVEPAPGPMLVVSSVGRSRAAGRRRVLLPANGADVRRHGVRIE